MEEQIHLLGDMYLSGKKTESGGDRLGKCNGSRSTHISSGRQ